MRSSIVLCCKLIAAAGGHDTHNLIVGGRRIVSPGSLLHDTPSDSLEVEKIVALRQQRLELLALFALNLFRVVVFAGSLFDGAHVDGAEVLGVVKVLVEGVGRMDGFEFFGRIFSLGTISGQCNLRDGGRRRKHTAYLRIILEPPGCSVEARVSTCPHALEDPRLL